MTDEQQAEWEARIEAACDAVGLVNTRQCLAREVVLLHLVDGMTARQIRWKLKASFTRTSEVAEVLAVGLAKLAALESVRTLAHEFERQLLPCAENRDDHDERPADMRGVTADRSSDRFQGARVVAQDDLRLKQEPRSAVRLWVRSIGPPPVPAVV